VAGTPGVAFGSVTIAATAQLPIQLVNSGTAEGTLTLPAFAGANPADFSLAGSTCVAVQPNAMCQVLVAFSPASAGTKTASLTMAGTSLQYTGTGVAPVVAPDPATAMLLHMNGAPGSTTFVDEKGNSISQRGGTTISAAAPAFGNGAASFNGVNQALVFSNEVFNFGAADYTVEAWVRPAAGNNALQTLIANSWGWQLYWAGSSVSLYISQIATGPNYYGGTPMYSAAGSVPAATWTHIAVVRRGSVLSLYTNGRLAASIPFTASQVTPVYPASIGTVYSSNTGTGYYFSGQIDEFRVTKNLARYSANFTPETQEFSR
jgi:hypothetical protein